MERSGHWKLPMQMFVHLHVQKLKTKPGIKIQMDFKV